MILYAACDLNAPHIVRAFINNDDGNTPAGFTCIMVDEELVDEGSLTVGMIWDKEVGFQTYTPAIPEIASITAAQAKLALYNTGLLDQVSAAVSKYIPMQIFFDNSPTWGRNHPYILGMAAELGLSSDQVDQLFYMASQL